MRTQEEWRPVVGYEGLYMVSDLGRVKSVPRKWAKGGILKPAPDRRGYLRVDLSKNGKKETCRVHILVMRAFKGKCPTGHEVDHINFKRDDNRLSNLSYQPKEVNRGRHCPEWLVKMQKLSQDPEWLRKNAEAAKRTKSKPVDQFTLDGKFVKRWPSATDAARELGISKCHISSCCNGKRKSAGGYIWKLKEAV